MKTTSLTFSLSLTAALISLVCTASLPAADSLTAWFVDGKASLTFRPRYEFASFENGTDDAHALTLKTLLGYTTSDWNGFSAKIEFTDTHAIDDDTYNAAGLNGEADKAIIADPETTELNQFFVSYKTDILTATVGRQRYILDNARFVGNVGWRQNEQTFDAATLKVVPVEGFTINAAYIDRVNRILSDARDWSSESILLNATYKVSNEFSITGYYYHLDFNGAVATTDTFGAYATGKMKVSDNVALNYRAEIASQERDSSEISTM